VVRKRHVLEPAFRGTSLSNAAHPPSRHWKESSHWRARRWEIRIAEAGGGSLLSSLVGIPPFSPHVLPARLTAFRPRQRQQHHHVSSVSRVKKTLLNSKAHPLVRRPGSSRTSHPAGAPLCPSIHSTARSRLEATHRGTIADPPQLPRPLASLDLSLFCSGPTTSALAPGRSY